MKSGGLVRVRTNVLSPESTYKAVFISRCTTVRQLINLVISGSKTEEAPDNFRLREASADFEVDRILQEDEYPLEVQSQWKPDEGRSLFLTRVNKKVDTKSDQNLPVSTSEELKNEIAKQNQTIDTLNDVITRLQQERDLKESLLSSPNTLSSEYSDLDKGDYDQIDDIDEMPQFHCYRSPVRETEETFDSVEKLRQRRTSLDALDLKYASNDKEMAVRSKCLTSQIDKLRYSFYQFKRKGISDIDIRKDIDTGKPKESRYSQIERFRHKFLQYYKMKTVPGKVPLRRVQSTIVLPSMPVTTRSWSSSDADCITHLRELEKIFSRKASDDSLCDQEIRELFENSAARKQEDLKQAGQRTLYDVINDMGLFTVTLNRNPDEGLGLELAQVTQKGSPIEKDPTDVLYVYHKRDGETAILDNPTRDFIEEVETSSPCEDDVFSQSLESHDENHTCFGSQSKNSSAETTPIKHHNSIDENSSHLNGETESGSMSCCTLSEWRVGLGPKPRHGVRIVGMTKGGIAEKCGILEKDDVIVEVNGTNVLNSTLKVVIETLREQRTVHLVVAREKARHKVQEDNVGEPSSLGSSPVPSHHEEMLALTEQVKQLVTKVTELQESMTKKDKTIAHLKKSIMKKKLKISSKDKIVEAVQVLV